jgi:hypothetical protein
VSQFTSALIDVKTNEEGVPIYSPCSNLAGPPRQRSRENSGWMEEGVLKAVVRDVSLCDLCWCLVWPVGAEKIVVTSTVLDLRPPLGGLSALAVIMLYCCGTTSDHGK